MPSTIGMQTFGQIRQMQKAVFCTLKSRGDISVTRNLDGGFFLLG